MTSDFAGYYEVSGAFGYGDEQLGTVTMASEYTVSGSNVTSKPVSFYASTATTGVVFEGDLIDACGGQTGSSVDGKYSFLDVGDVPAYTSRFWEPNGYNSYWGGGACKSQVTQWSWNVPDGPSGHWYVYAKSPCFTASTVTPSTGSTPPTRSTCRPTPAAAAFTSPDVPSRHIRSGVGSLP